MTQCIVGIDPGISGAVAFFFTAAPDMVSAEDAPVVAGMLDAATLAARIRQMKPDMAIVEQVSARPGQGVSSMFRFGQAYGMAIGVIAACGVPVCLVVPTKWKKHYGLSADKEDARKRALQLWPARAELFQRKKDHGRAEAALLARYGAEVLP